MYNVLYIHLATLPYIDLGPNFWKKKFSRFVNIDFIVVHNAPDHYANMVHISRITNSELWKDIPKIVLSVDNTNIYNKPENWNFFEENIDLFNIPQENCGHIKLGQDIHFINDFNDTKSHLQWKEEFSKIHSERHINYLVLKPTNIYNLYSDIVEIHDESLLWPHGQKSFGILMVWNNSELTITERFYVSEKTVTNSISSLSDLEEILVSLEDEDTEDLISCNINLHKIDEMDPDFHSKAYHLLSQFSDIKQPMIVNWQSYQGDD